MNEVEVGDLKELYEHNPGSVVWYNYSLQNNSFFTVDPHEWRIVNKPSWDGLYDYEVVLPVMQFLSNIYDHRMVDAPSLFSYSFAATKMGPEAMDFEWQQHLNWINSKTIGRPLATPHYNRRELENKYMIGIYGFVASKYRRK